MKIKILFCVFGLFCYLNLTLAQDANTPLDLIDESTVRSEESTDASELSNTKIFYIKREKEKDSTINLSDNEITKTKAAGFYAFVNDTLYKDNSFMKYPRRIDCIIETLKKNEAINEVGGDVEIEILTVQNRTISIVVNNTDILMYDVQNIVNDANFGCLLPGLFSVMILSVIMTVVVSCVVCLSKGDTN